MQSLTHTLTALAIVAVAASGAAVSLTSQASASPAAVPVAKVTVAKTRTAAEAVAALKPAKPPVITLAAPAAAQTAVTPSEKSLRAQMKYETVKWDGKPVATLDEASRVLLVKAAAEKVGLEDVGLSFHDIYGIIEAETSWIPRTGSSKNGTPNLGLAQFEPYTARAYGVQDPGDPIQAVFGAAKYIKEGAQWAHRKLAGLKLSPEQHALKVREGVSVYYNLSIKGRNKWDGTNAAQLPVETQRHISNARAGAAEAAQLAKLIKI